MAGSHIPLGFSCDGNHVGGIVPAVRYSDCSTPGKGGVALLDRGLSGREINGNVPIPYLHNATEYYGYFNAWLGGRDQPGSSMRCWRTTPTGSRPGCPNGPGNTTERPCLAWRRS